MCTVAELIKALDPQINSYNKLMLIGVAKEQELFHSTVSGQCVQQEWVQLVLYLHLLSKLKREIFSILSEWE